MLGCGTPTSQGLPAHRIQPGYLRSKAVRRSVPAPVCPRTGHARAPTLSTLIPLSSASRFADNRTRIPILTFADPSDHKTTQQRLRMRKSWPNCCSLNSRQGMNVSLVEVKPDVQRHSAASYANPRWTTMQYGFLRHPPENHNIQAVLLSLDV